MATQRLFVALPLPDAIRASLLALMAPLRGIRWTPVRQLHLTMRFLGDVEIDRMDTLVQRLGDVHVAPFILPMEGVGAFPPKAPPRVLWAGVGTGHPLLYQLRQQVDDAVLAAGANPELRTFHPHVTLARCEDSSARVAEQWVRNRRDFAGPSFQIDAFELWASELHAFGAVHSLVSRFPLTPRSAGVAHPP